MHIAIIFYNIGGYHAARLHASQTRLQQNGNKLTAIQITSSAEEHPWGNLKDKITFPLITILPDKQNIKETSTSSFDIVTTMKETLKTLQPDVVAIPGWGFSFCRAALSWCLHNNVPTIVMSESKFDDEKRYWWREFLKSFLIKKFKAALVGGKAHKDYLIKLGFPEKNIFQGYDAVDNDHFHQGADKARQNPAIVRQKQPKIPEKPYFISVTRLIKRKNIERLVKAYAVYRKKVGIEQAWDMVICGSGVEEPAIKRLINEKNITHCVHLPGFVSYKAIINWYGLANAFIHPALQEQWGLVLNEACAAGLPILASLTVGASPELVRDGENGFLFDPSSLDEICTSLIKIHNITAASRQKMGASARKSVAAYGPEQFANGLLNCISVALHNN